MARMRKLFRCLCCGCGEVIGFMTQQQTGTEYCKECARQKLEMNFVCGDDETKKELVLI